MALTLTPLFFYYNKQQIYLVFKRFILTFTFKNEPVKVVLIPIYQPLRLTNPFNSPASSIILPTEGISGASGT